MFTKSLVLFCVLIFHDASCSKGDESVVVARYKIKNNNKANYDPTTVMNINADNFPEVEYPSNIVDSSKPFYMNTSPFSNDVKTAFKSMAPGNEPNNKSNPTIILNLKSSDKSKNQTSSDEVKVDSTGMKKDNSTETLDKETKEAVIEEILVLEEIEDINTDILAVQMEIANMTEEIIGLEEVEYMISLMADLDDFITTLPEKVEELNNTNNTDIYEFDCDEDLDVKPIEKMAGNNETEELNEFILDNEAKENITEITLY